MPLILQTQLLITELKTAHQLTTQLDQSSLFPCYILFLENHFNNLILSMSNSSKCLLSLRSPQIILYAHLFLYTFQMRQHLSSFSLSKQYRSCISPLCSLLQSTASQINLSHKYLLQHSILRHPQFSFLPQYNEANFTPRYKEANYISLYICLFSFDNKMNIC
jgi:hypothetical protein